MLVAKVGDEGMSRWLLADGFEQMAWARGAFSRGSPTDSGVACDRQGRVDAEALRFRNGGSDFISFGSLPKADYTII